MHPEISPANVNADMVIQSNIDQDSSSHVDSDVCNGGTHLPMEDREDNYDDSYNPAFTEEDDNYDDF